MSGVVAVRKHARALAFGDGSCAVQLAISMPDPETCTWVAVYRIGTAPPAVNATCALAMGGRGLLDLHMVDCREAGGVLAAAIARMSDEGDSSIRAVLARPAYGATLAAQHAFDPTLTVLKHAYGAACQFPTGRFEVTELRERRR